MGVHVHDELIGKRLGALSAISGIAASARLAS
jgi:hypothetical protein